MCRYGDRYISGIFSLFLRLFLLRFGDCFYILDGVVRMGLDEQVLEMHQTVFGSLSFGVGLSRERCSGIALEVMGILGVYGELGRSLEISQLDLLRQVLEELLVKVVSWVGKCGMMWIDGREYTIWEMLHRELAMVEVFLRNQKRG